MLHKRGTLSCRILTPRAGAHCASRRRWRADCAKAAPSCSSVLAGVLCVALAQLRSARSGLLLPGRGRRRAQPRRSDRRLVRRCALFPVRRAGLSAAADARLCRLAHAARARSRRAALAAECRCCARAGFVLLLVASCALAALHWSAEALPQGAGGIVGTAAGDGLAAGLDLLGATLLLLAAWLAGAAVAFGVSWFTVMDRVGRGTWARRRAGCARAGAPPVSATSAARRGSSARRRAQAAQALARRAAPRSRRRSRRRHRRRPRASAPSASGRCRCSIRRPRRSCRRSSCWMIRRRARMPTRPRRWKPCRAWSSSSCKRLRRRGRGGRGASGAGGHALRDAAGAGRQGEPDHRTVEGSGALALDHQRARGRGDSRQVGHGTGDPERAARARDARRDHQIQGLRGRRLAAHAGARQGHRRRGRWWPIWRACRTC